MENSIKLTVFFEQPFWVGIFERVCEERYEVSRVVFGSEPKDYQVYDFILKNFYNVKFSNSLSVNEVNEFSDRKVNPKRLQREIKKETENRGIGTKAQLAMKLQQQESKIEKKEDLKEEKEAENKRKFQLRQQKKFKRHKGH